MTSENILTTREGVSIIELEGVVFPHTIQTVPGRDPNNEVATRMRSLLSSSRSSGRSNSDVSAATDYLRDLDNMFLEDVSRHLEDEDTVFCASSGELALRVLNALLNASDEEEAKLCFVAHRPASFMYSPNKFRSMHDTHARKDIVEGAIEDGVLGRKARWCQTKKELERFCKEHKGSDVCFISSCGTAVGLLNHRDANGVPSEARTQRAIDWTLSKGLELYHTSDKYKQDDRGVIAVACPHAILRNVFNMAGDYLKDPVRNLRYGAFSPKDFDAWTWSRKECDRYVAQLIEGDPEEGIKQHTPEEALRKMQMEFHKALLNEDIPIPEALARARDPAEFAGMVLADTKKNELTEIFERPCECLIKKVPDQRSPKAKMLAVASCCDWICLGACAQAMKDVLNKAASDLRTTAGSLQATACVIDGWDKLTILYGAPMHILKALPMAKPVRISEYCRISPLAEHVPEPSRILELDDRKVREAKELSRKLLPETNSYFSENETLQDTLKDPKEQVLVPLILLQADPNKIQNQTRDSQRQISESQDDMEFLRQARIRTQNFGRGFRR